MTPTPSSRATAPRTTSCCCPTTTARSTATSTAERVRALCDRRGGIGGDGVLRVVRRRRGAWFMDYRNADGSVAEMCGNGIRVFALHLVQEGLADAGVADPSRHPRRRQDRHRRTATRSPSTWASRGCWARPRSSVGERTWPAHHVDVGNPHAVAFVDDLADAGVAARGADLRRGGLPRRRQRRVRRAPRRAARRDARARARARARPGRAAPAPARWRSPRPWPTGRRDDDYRVDLPGGTLTDRAGPPTTGC